MKVFWTVLLCWLAPLGAFAQTASFFAHEYGPAALMARETHGAVEVFCRGEGEHRVYLFVPERPALHGAVGVVFFHHGWQGMSPKNFGALIDHLVREGEVVVYPVYQDSAATSPQVVVGNAAAADRDGLGMMAGEGLSVDPARVLYFGYSMGAAISLDLAIAPGRYGLPAPDALLLLAPGDAPAVAVGAAGRPIIGDIGRLPRTLPVAVLAGAEDTQIGLPTAHRIFPALCGILPDRRVLEVLPGDSRDGVTVHAGHGAPGAPDVRYDFVLEDKRFPRVLVGAQKFPASVSINQLDYYGFWKVADALIGSFGTGKLPGVVFDGRDAGQSYLGSWEDGTAFKRAVVEEPCRD